MHWTHLIGIVWGFVCWKIHHCTYFAFHYSAVKGHRMGRYNWLSVYMAVTRSSLWVVIFSSLLMKYFLHEDRWMSFTCQLCKSQCPRKSKSGKIDFLLIHFCMNKPYRPRPYSLKGKSLACFVKTKPMGSVVITKPLALWASKASWPKVYFFWRRV